MPGLHSMSPHTSPVSSDFPSCSQKLKIKKTNSWWKHINQKHRNRLHCRKIISVSLLVRITRTKLVMTTQSKSSVWILKGKMNSTRLRLLADTDYLSVTRALGGPDRGARACVFVHASVCLPREREERVQCVCAALWGAVYCHWCWKWITAPHLKGG